MRPSAGRPSRAQQEQRHEELLDAALDAFLEGGFEQTTMEAIAGRVGMSKRTLYARHEDKADLFKAAVRRAIERYTIPRAALEAVASDDLAETLMAVGRLRIANLAMPVSTKLMRILTAQSYRFPELFVVAFKQGTSPTFDFLCDLFARHVACGEIDISEPRRAAGAYLSLVVGGPSRIIVSGIGMEEHEIEASVRFAVRLFLDGVKKR